MMMQYLDALAGAGKTRALSRYADRLARQGLKVLVAQPTKYLIDKTIADELRPLQPPYPCRAIHGDISLGGSIVAEIIDHMAETKPGRGEILIITHSALLRLPRMFAQYWHLIIDEVPQCDVPEDLNLPDTQHLIVPHLAMLQSSPEYGVLQAENPDALDRIALNWHGDTLYDVLGGVAARILSDGWIVYASSEQFRRLRERKKTNCSLSTFSLLQPSFFECYASLIVASACMTDTTFFLLFRSLGVDWHPVDNQILADLRYSQHSNGERVTIYYATEQAWSKTYRDRAMIDQDGSTTTVLRRVRREVIDLVGDGPMLWMGNKDINDNFFRRESARRLPNTPHGLNIYQDYHNIVVISALNPPPAHFAFLAAHGVTAEELRTGCYRTAVYQAVMRCSIRNPADTNPKRVIVMDRDTADWLAAKYPGCTVAPLASADEMPSKGRPGRPRQYADAAARARAYRARKHLAGQRTEA